MQNNIYIKERIMETKSFLKLLRKVIREEVQSVVRKEMRLALNERKVDHKKVIDHGMDLHNVVSTSRKSSTTKKKKFVKDNMLNDILNETAHTADFTTMNDPASIYQTNAVEDFASSRQSTKPLVTNDVNGAPVNMQNKNVAKTVDLMSKDYSSLMKAIEKKKGR